MAAVSKSKASRCRSAAAAAVLLAAALPAVAVAADAAAGKARSAACSACHGAMGASAMPGTPNLAGQPEEYLAAQLGAYKSGARKHEVMSLMAAPPSAADIANLAAWYASIRIEAKPPQ